MNQRIRITDVVSSSNSKDYRVETIDDDVGVASGIWPVVIGIVAFILGWIATGKFLIGLVTGVICAALSGYILVIATVGLFALLIINFWIVMKYLLIIGGVVIVAFLVFAFLFGE